MLPHLFFFFSSQARAVSSANSAGLGHSVELMSATLYKQLTAVLDPFLLFFLFSKCPVNVLTVKGTSESTFVISGSSLCGGAVAFSLDAGNMHYGIDGGV